jgi:putative ATPase
MSEPLATKLRPQTLDEVIGQEHLTAPGAPIWSAIEKQHLFSFLLWGPPGVGKTTIARIYAKAQGAEFFELSAVRAGKSDITDIIKKETNGKPKILFLDEIHRFNKAQQDYLLPFVETGELTLIGATTENPSFEVIPALLSRVKVFVLKELSEDALSRILIKAHVTDETVRSAIILLANGDARRALGVLEETERLYGTVSIAHIEKTIHSKHLRYDALGEEHYNTVSAFIKSMRASQPDATLYYLARMIDAGEDPLFIARRMVIFASEDVGLAQPTALVVANAVFRAVETVGMPEARINLAHGAVYLAEAKKDRRAYEGLEEALSDVARDGNLPIPLQIRNAPTKLMGDLGYGKGYESYTREDLLPERLRGKTYFRKPQKGHDTIDA